METNVNVWTKLLKFQSKLETIQKTKTAEVVMKSGGKFKYSYADLSEVMQAIRPILTEVGLVIVQPMESDSICTIVMCPESMTEIRCCIPLANKNLSPQELGSYITYMRRYSITSLLCLDTDVDDDANQAQTAKPNQTKQEAKPKESDKIEVSFDEIVLLISAGSEFEIKPSGKDDGIAFIIVKHENKTKYAKGVIKDDNFQKVNTIYHERQKVKQTLPLQ